MNLVRRICLLFYNLMTQILRFWFRVSFSLNIYVHEMSNKKHHQYLDFIARSLPLFRVLSVPIIRSTITVFDSHWYNVRYVVIVVVQCV
jgi:hypothetical protein